MDINNINSKDFILLSDYVSGVYLQALSCDTNGDPIFDNKTYTVYKHIPTNKYVIQPNEPADPDSEFLNLALKEVGRLN